MEYSDQSINPTEDQDVSKIYEALGSKDNILELTHCISRVRFTIRNMVKVNRMELSKLNLNVIYTQNDQVHLVLGKNTKAIFDVFEKMVK
ncbi:MAG: PTS transporter subunit EIIB [Brevinema sp.]